MPPHRNTSTSSGQSSPSVVDIDTLSETGSSYTSVAESLDDVVRQLATVRGAALLDEDELEELDNKVLRTLNHGKKVSSHV